MPIDMDRYGSALRNAHNAGDVAAAKEIANAIKAHRNEGFAQQSASMNPDDLMIARTKNDPMGDYLRTQAQQPREGESYANRQQRLYGSLPDSNAEHESDTRTFVNSMVEGVPIIGGHLQDGVNSTAAFVDSMFSDRSYDQNKDRANQIRKMDKVQNPYVDFAGQATGAIATMAPVAATSIGSNAMGIAGKNLMTRTAAATASGSTLSGVDTAARGGSANDIMTNSLLGGGFGLAGPTIGKAATKGVGKLSNFLYGPKLASKAHKAAVKKINQRFEADGTNLPQLQKRIAKNPGMSLVDLAGPNTQNLLKTTTNLPGNAQNTVNQRLVTRQMAQGERIKKSLAETFANTGGYLNVKETITQKSREIAAPLYEKAYANPVPFTRELEGILKTPSGKQALQKAINIAGNEQAPFMQWFANVAENGTASIKRVPDMRAWDYIKRGLDDVIESQTDNLTGKVTTSGHSVIGLKKRLLANIDKANPDYAAARKVASDGFKVDDALEFGKNSHKFPAEAIKRKFANWSEAEKQAARIGKAESLRGFIDKAGWTHNKMLKVMNSKEQLHSLRAMFVDVKSFQEFRKTIFNEARKQSTFNTIRGGSSTIKQAADMVDFGNVGEFGGAALDVSVGNKIGMINRVVKFANRMKGMTPEVSDEIARMLTASNPKIIKAMTNDLIKISQADLHSGQKIKLIEGIVRQVGGTQVPQTMQALR